MENRGYSIYEVGILGGNDKVKTNLFVLFVLSLIILIVKDALFNLRKLHNKVVENCTTKLKKIAQ